MSVDDKSPVAFGRRGREAGPVTVRAASAAASAGGVGGIVAPIGVAVLVFVVGGVVFWALPGIGRLNAEEAQATASVVEIVNQPITHLRRSGPVDEFSPGWFHPGAIKPDFNTVDIRTTQEFPYRSSSHVTSDVNPTEMFIGSELEFNAMTKYFYTDRTLPKRRLSDSEMGEINHLYRVIGNDERARFFLWLKIAGLVAAGLVSAIALLQSSRVASAG